MGTNKGDDIGDRMKEYYENIPKTRLMRRCPVVIRIDGKAFHTLTRGMKRPFDEVLIKSMQDTMKDLCENIQGCVLGYHQSDEISLILVDYQKLETSAWLDYEVQKMCSIAASMATRAFNKYIRINSDEYIKASEAKADEEYLSDEQKKIEEKAIKAYTNAMDNAMFDARVFNIPKEEVTNYVYWRQLDASCNSVQMVGRANFSHKQLQNKSGNEIQDMLMVEKGINWNDFPVYEKRGSCCVKETYFVNKKGKEVENDFICDVDEPVEVESDLTERHRWIVDKNIPIFKGQDRDYIDKLIYVGEQ